MTQMTYQEFVESEEFENYVQDIEAWEELPPDLQAQVAGTGANILGIAITDNRDLQDVGDIALDDYPEAAQENARMALDAREETGNPNDCLTDTGWAVANNLDSGDPISQSQLESMSAFERFEEHKDQGEEGRADCGWMAWKAWGGDEGIRWADSKMDEFEEARENSAAHNHAHSCGFHLSDGELEDAEEWEHALLEVYQNAFDADGDVRLADLTERSLPDFVRQRIRDSIMGGALFSDFDTIDNSRLQELQTFMIDELAESEGWTFDTISEKLQEFDSSLSDSEAETIARTETQSIINDAREEGYEETGMIENEEFYWTGSIDDRTTDACRWLIGGTSEAENIGGAFDGTNPNYGGNPVSLDELKDLVKEAARKDPEIDTEAREWTPHINCRKTYVRNV